MTTQVIKAIKVCQSWQLWGHRFYVN